MKVLFTIVALLGISAPLAEAKITRISREEITDLSIKYTNGGCRKNDGEKVVVTIAARNETFTFTYCSQQVLSAAMEDVYPRLRKFVAGPNLGSHCSIKTWCDTYGRCQYENGVWEEGKAELIIISDDKNKVEAESFNDIQVRTNLRCKPVSCAR